LRQVRQHRLAGVLLRVGVLWRGLDEESLTMP
jgi:hypothetical protein